ncbi:importin-9 isoform X1 [Tachysurus ichikawai]
MAGMGATAPSTSSVASPVQQGLKEALIETLTAILSPVQEVRASAEEQIKVLEVTEGKHVKIFINVAKIVLAKFPVLPVSRLLCGCISVESRRPAQ